MPEAIPVFADPHAVTIPDDESTVGVGAIGRLLVVVYTWRGDDIRIISARPAEPHERTQYEAEL
jgi:uncharacterized DUF497 family protein